MDNINILVGNLIREKRKEVGLSTKELADKLGISAGLLNNIENSKNDTFHLELLVSISALLNIDIFQLISNINNSKSKGNNNSSFFNNQLSDKLKIVNYKIYELVVDSDNLSRSIKMLDKLVDDIEFYKTL